MTLRIDKSKTPNCDIYLIKTQIKQIGNGKRNTISKARLKKKRGFLPFLIPLLILVGLEATTGVGAWQCKTVIK